MFHSCKDFHGGGYYQSVAIFNNLNDKIMTLETQQKLFNYLSIDHSLTLLQSDMQQIENIITKGLAKEKSQQIICELNDYALMYSFSNYGLPSTIEPHNTDMNKIVSDILTDQFLTF